MNQPAIIKLHHNEADDYPADLKAEILEAIGKIDHIEIFGEEVLVAAFVQTPFFGNGQMLKGEKLQNEDKWQSKSFLVIKIGDGVEAACKRSGRKVPKVGEWYFGNVQEQWQLSVRGKGWKSRKDPKDASHYLRPWGEAGWPCRTVLLADIRGATNGRPQDVI